MDRNVSEELRADRRAVMAGRAAVDAHGGIGFTWSYPRHLWLKRAMYDRAAFGLPAKHRERAAVLAGW